MELMLRHGLKVSSAAERKMQELQSHYDDTSEGPRKKKFSRAYLTKIFYKNDTIFTVKKYVIKLKVILNVLGKYGFPLYEKHMVNHRLDHIMSPNTELKTEVNICRSSHFSTFFKAYNYLYTVVARLYPSANPSSERFRKRSIYAAGRGDHGDGRGGRLSGRGRGRGRG